MIDKTTAPHYQDGTILSTLSGLIDPLTPTLYILFFYYYSIFQTIKGKGESPDSADNLAIIIVGTDQRLPTLAHPLVLIIR